MHGFRRPHRDERRRGVDGGGPCIDRVRGVSPCTSAAACGRPQNPRG